MSPIPSNAPVSKGRKSQRTRWIDILPTGAPPNSEQELSLPDFIPPGNGNGTSAERGGTSQAIGESRERVFQHELLHPQAFRLHAPIPQAAPGIFQTSLSRSQTPLNRPQTPADRPHTPLNRSLTPLGRPLAPSSRPQTPQTRVSLGQRPPDIVVPPPSQIRQRLVAYNPVESARGLDSSVPVPHGRRNVPIHASLGSDMPRPPRQPGYSIESSGPIARGSRNQSRDTTYMSIPKCERGLLIIGSSHRESTPYTAELPPLLGIQNDRDLLRKAFQSRKYSVETMVEEEGNKHEILRRVGNFLSSADEGNIRVIVFTGHAAKIGTDQQFAIIPPGCSSEDDTISSTEWQNAVIRNAGPGVVVVSVFATCMSGAMVEQSVKLTNFDRIVERQSLATDLPNGPIQIILSSSGSTQSSFEYHTPREDSSSSWHDYFLWALAETTQRADIDSWESFVRTLQSAFTYVRATSFRRENSFQYPHDLDWLLRNPQTPRIFVSSQIPDFDRFLPPQDH